MTLMKGKNSIEGTKVFQSQIVRSRKLNKLKGILANPFADKITD